MRNYADELLHEELSQRQKDVVQATTRFEWNNRFWKGFIMPAITGKAWMGNGDSFRATSIDDYKIEHFGQVLPIEDVEKVIEMVDSITRMPCGCRFDALGKTDQRYCFGFSVDKWGTLGKFPEATTSLEVLEKEATKKIFRSFDEEGLMHSIWTGVTPYVVGLCNCDRDCGAYRGYIGGRGKFFRAEYVGQVDWEQCDGCRSCMSQCQFGAMFYSSALGKVYIDPKRCFGCGTCRAACPKLSISLQSRQSVPEAANLWI